MLIVRQGSGTRGGDLRNGIHLMSHIFVSSKIYYFKFLFFGVCVLSHLCRCSESAAIVDNLVLKGGGSTTFVLPV